MGAWLDEGFDILDVSFEKVGSGHLATFRIAAHAPISRAWVGGRIFYEYPKVLSLCYGAIRHGNDLYVLKMSLSEARVPRITIEC